MKFFSRIIPKKIAEGYTRDAEDRIRQRIIKEPMAFLGQIGLGGILRNHVFTGEKNLFQSETARPLLWDIYSIANRCWNSYMRNDLMQTLINKFSSKIIGGGLRFDSQPKNKALQMLGYSPVSPEQKKQIETLFGLHASSPLSIFDLSSSFNSYQYQAFKSALIGGDVLILFRIKGKKWATIQMIDGRLVRTTADSERLKNSNNTVLQGIEKNRNGVVVAYHIVNSENKSERIRVWNNGIKQAVLVRGADYRPGDNRGFPRFGAVLEKISCLDRYAEASVGGAEKLANYPLQVVHDKDAVGINPLQNEKMLSSIGQGEEVVLPPPPSFEAVAGGVHSIGISPSNQALNMPTGSRIETTPVANYTENYPAFFDAMFNQIIMMLLSPPEVIRSQYGNNYSASRAAILDSWMIFKLFRKYFAEQFCQNYYIFWLVWNNAVGSLQLPQLTRAVSSGDIDAIHAIASSRWVGEKPPSIDPKKEADALRVILGDKFSNLPLGDIQQALEILGYEGDLDSFLEKIKEEQDKIVSAIGDTSGSGGAST